MVGVKQFAIMRKIIEDKKEISEEVLNKLTYQVFQNIKSYLEHHPINKPQVPERSKHIKLEISL